MKGRPDPASARDIEQDVLVLLEYYRQHKPAFANRPKCLKVIASFQAKSKRGQHQVVRTAAEPNWRDKMYETIAAQRGVDPRQCWDASIGSTVATAVAERERGRTQRLAEQRRSAWVDAVEAKKAQERPLAARQAKAQGEAATQEAEAIEKPWRHTAPQTVAVTVPPDGYAGQRLTVRLPDGTVFYPVVPPNCPPGQTFAAPSMPPQPDIRAKGGGYRVMVDLGRDPYARQTELVMDAYQPAHPGMPHIDYWSEPQHNVAPRGGLAESEYQDRYLGFWRSDDLPGLGAKSSGGTRDNQWLREISKANYFARLPESRKEPEGARSGVETGSKRAELARTLAGNHGTSAGPHADELLGDVQTQNSILDDAQTFRGRPSSLLAQRQPEGGGVRSRLRVLRRYAVMHGGTTGQGCELQLCSGDISSSTLDAIVAPAYPDLSAGSGVNARIHSAAGPFFGRILQKVTEISPGLRVDTGAAVATLAADLAVQYVIHAAGPVHHSAPRWQAMVFTGKSSRNDPPLGRPRTSRNYTEEQVPGLLAGAYTAALQLANRLKLTSVALPAISCDVGGYPHAEAARIALDTCLRRTAIGGLELIQFVLTNRFEESAWMQAASKKIRFNVLKASAAGASAEDEAQSEEHRALLEAFRQFDETGDGQISPQEFRRGIDAMNIELPRELLTQMVQKLCVDRVDTVWQGIDTDSSGVLDAQEFRAVMAKIDPRMGGEEVAKLAAQLDRDGDGGISKQEFSRWFMRQPARTREALVSINYKEFVAQHDPVESRLRRLFNDLDEDGSGSLDRSELHRLCKDMGAELSQRELNDAMREMDADGSGEVDFEEFAEWWLRARKHSRKIAAAVSEFKARRDAGAARQAVAFGRPTAGVSGLEAEARARGAHLPHRLMRQKQRSSAAITQLEPEIYEQQLHAGVLLGETPVTVKPGQQAGAGARESHYAADDAADPSAAHDARDPNGYVPYRPDAAIITAVVQRQPPGTRPGKLRKLRAELEGLGVRQLRERAHAAGVPAETVDSWWATSARQRTATVGAGANEDNHYTLVPPWDADPELRKVTQYIRPRAQDDLGRLHKPIEGRTCWVGRIPLQQATKEKLSRALEEEGFWVEDITVREKADEDKGRSQNRSWALVTLKDARLAERMTRARIAVDGKHGQPVFLQVRMADVSAELRKKHLAAGNQGSDVLGALEAVSDAHATHGAAETSGRLTKVQYARNPGGYGAGSLWPDGHRDPHGESQGRPSYPLDEAGWTDAWSEAPLTRGKWVSDAQRHYVADVQAEGDPPHRQPADGVRKGTVSWGETQYAPPKRNDLHTHWGKRYVGRNPDDPFDGWGQERPGFPNGMRDYLRHS